MNENTRRSEHWQRLIAEFLAPRLGGTASAWAAANATVANAQIREYISHFEAQPESSWSEYWAEYEDQWMLGMCSLIGIIPPADRAERRRLSRACDLYVTPRVRAAYPGAAAAIRQLHRAGYLLHTASGETSWELDGYLRSMRVRKCFDRLYGPDYVDVAKFSPRYYERIFAHASIAPVEAVVVDDNEQALNWAADIGAQTILCRLAPPSNPRHGHISSLAALPDYLN
jgi:phosphoglycolate phosphatase-like HAD superfamily hydrolase